MKNRQIYLSPIGAVLLIIVAGTPLPAQTPPSKESVGEFSREALALDFDIREQTLTAAIQAATTQGPVTTSQLLDRRHAALKDLVSGGGPLNIPGSSRASGSQGLGIRSLLMRMVRSSRPKIPRVLVHRPDSSL